MEPLGSMSLGKGFERFLSWLHFQFTLWITFPAENGIWKLPVLAICHYPYSSLWTFLSKKIIQDKLNFESAFVMMLLNKNNIKVTNTSPICTPCEGNLICSESISIMSMPWCHDQMMLFHSTLPQTLAITFFTFSPSATVFAEP